MRKSRLLERIEKEVSKKRLKQFRVSDLDCLKKSKSFLSKHRKGNPGDYTVYFIRLKEKGLYKLA